MKSYTSDLAMHVHLLERCTCSKITSDNTYKRGEHLENVNQSSH